MESKIQLLVIGFAAVLCMIVRQPWVMCGILAIALLVNLCMGFWFQRRQEREIDALILYLMKVQDRLELPEFDSMEEGRLGILQSEIYKLVVQLKEQYSGERKQKKYMVDMLSDISHQIKTPMTAITLMTDLLSAPKLSDEKRLEYVEKIAQQTNRITWLVRNLLTLSQLEADMLELKKEDISLCELLDTIVDTFEIMAEVKEIELLVDCPREVLVTCDKQWTREAISNIVKNCIEHTKEGGRVCIEVQQNNLATEILIQDTGEGIPKEHLPNIFKRFFKAPGASGNSVGIGLSMSKQIIMRQNGTIQVESEVGVGSKFTVKLYRS